MNLVQLASHTVDLELLAAARNPRVLDVGCRWFDFADAIRKVSPFAVVIAMDPALDVERRDWSDVETGASLEFLRAALVGEGPVFQRLAHFSTGEGDFLTTLDRYHDAEFYEVPCMPVKQVMESSDITHFDVVKLDCEGSEFGILENWPGPIATQISVEFHDWDKPKYRAEGYYDLLWKRLPWYRVVQHELSKQGEGVGHWDSLLVLR